LGNQRPGANNGLRAFNGAGVDNGSVPHRNIIADDARVTVSKVKDSVVLNVRVVAYDDPIDVASKDGAKPNARIVPDRNVAQNGGTLSDVNPGAEHGLLIQKGIKLAVD
jgi:hypothetical protein